MRVFVAVSDELIRISAREQSYKTREDLSPGRKSQVLEKDR